MVFNPPFAKVTLESYFITAGRKLFEDFLKSEYSQENLQFWVACEQFKLIVNLNPADLEKEAEHIYQEYIRAEATRQVGPHSSVYLRITLYFSGYLWMKKKTFIQNLCKYTRGKEENALLM